MKPRRGRHPKNCQCRKHRGYPLFGTSHHKTAVGIVTSDICENDPLFISNKPEVPDIRSRPPKTDEELLEEYFAIKNYCDCPLAAGPHDSYRHAIKQKWAIEAELGKEKILEERVRRLEAKDCSPKRALSFEACLWLGWACFVFSLTLAIYISHTLL